MEEWRKKTYYQPRVLMDPTDFLSPEVDTFYLLCLDPGEAALLRYMLQYAHRRSTWAQEKHTNYYLAPDTDTWDLIEAKLANLEGHLMASCEDLLAAIESIGQWIEQTELTLDDILVVQGQQASALECICAKTTDIDINISLASAIDKALEDGLITVTDSSQDELAPELTSDSCAVAQLAWTWSYETLTEVVQPFQYSAHNILFGLLLAKFAYFLGGPVTGVTVGTISLLIDGVVDVVIAGEMEDTTNWLFANKEGLVCAMYDALENGGTLKAAAQAARDIINEAPELSPLDKVMFRVMFSTLFISRAKLAWTTATTWALARVSAGYCDVCSAEVSWEWQTPAEFTADWTNGLVNGSFFGVHENMGTMDTTVVLGNGFGGQNANSVRCEMTWRARHSSGWGVGNFRLHRWTGSDWVEFVGEPNVTTGDNGTVFYMDITEGCDIAPGTQVRLRVDARDSHTGLPYCKEMSRVKVTFARV